MKRFYTFAVLLLCIVVAVFAPACVQTDINETAASSGYSLTTSADTRSQSTASPLDSAQTPRETSEAMNDTDATPADTDPSSTSAPAITEQPPEQLDRLEVYFLDVGQADAAFLTCGGVNMLIDGGNKADSSLIYSFLSRKGVSHLDYIVCTHAHEDHAGGLAGALTLCTVGKLYSPVREYDSDAFEDVVAAASRRGVEITVPSPKESFMLGDASVLILAPLAEYENTNDTSIVLRITHGEMSFVFAADAERASENAITEEYGDLDSTVLKVGHHGSSTSSCYSFLRAIMPEYAVISVGRGNSYGHPDDDVLSRLRDCGATVYRTDECGDIICVSDGKSVAFTLSKQPGGTTAETERNPVGYIGNINSHKYHIPSCSSLPAEKNRIHFASSSEAESSGYTPCKRCLG